MAFSLCDGSVYLSFALISIIFCGNRICIIYSNNSYTVKKKALLLHGLVGCLLYFVLDWVCVVNYYQNLFRSS